MVEWKRAGLPYAPGYVPKQQLPENFDYFVKTVQIDGRVYDLHADVKKQYGVDGGYTYTLYLADNKKIKPAPPAATTSGSVKLGSQTLSSGNSIQQNQSAVNTTNENSRKIIGNAVTEQEAAQAIESSRGLPPYAKENLPS